MKKRDIIIDKGISGAYQRNFLIYRSVIYQNYLREGFHIEISLIFLTEKLLLLQLRGGIFCILKNMDYDKK